MPKSAASVSKLSRSARFRLVQAVRRNAVAAEENAELNNENDQRFVRAVPNGDDGNDNGQENPINDISDDSDGGGEENAQVENEVMFRNNNQAVRQDELPNRLPVPVPDDAQDSDSDDADSDIEVPRENNMEEAVLGGLDGNVENDGASDDEGEDSEGDNADNDMDMENEFPDRDDDLLARYGNQPLYAAAPVTVSECVAVVLTLMVDHSLTSSCVEDLLKVINLICPQNAAVKLSWYKLKKYFNLSTGPVRKRYYCSVCCRGLMSAQHRCRECQVEVAQSPSYFIQLPLAPQLEELFSRPNFYYDLQNRFTREPLEDGWMGDIYDGRLYKEQVQAGFLSNPQNFSMTYFTDGVPVFKSKNYSYWGFYLTINELPYKLRMKKENILLVGLWFGPKKPHANLFMTSFIADFQRLYNGIQVYCGGLQRRIQVRGTVLAGVADTPAKSNFLNCSHHNAFQGCPACEIVGETVHLPTGTETHAYRYQENVSKRTVERMMNQAREAVDQNSPVMGVKGPTALRLFMPDFIRGTAIDCMHLIQGIVKKLLKLHFSGKYSAFPFSLRRVVAVVDDYLLQMRPPKFVHRFPRSIEDLCHWKASELKIWFFYYSVPILQEVMRVVYFNHYLKLVMALSYLSSSTLSNGMIDKAEELLKEFVKDFQNLYGLRFCTINIHMLLHLAECVRELGPTWVYTCFPYEDLNGQTLRIIHGKTNIDTQVSRMHWHSLSLPNKLHFLQDGPVKDFCLKNRRHLKICERIDESVYAVGTFSTREINEPLILQGLRNSNIDFLRFKSYNRLLCNGSIYVAEQYTRDLRSSSSYVSYFNGDRILFGTVYTFVKVLTCECEVDCDCRGQHYAIIRGTDKMSDVTVPMHRNTYLKYMHRCTMSLNVSAIPLQSLKTVCFFMSVNDKLFLAEPVNKYEVE